MTKTLGWQDRKLSDLGFVGRGKSKHRPRNDPILYDGDYPFVQTGDIKNATLHLTNYSQTYNEKGLSQSKLWEPGTLCITIAANIAETAILGIKACFPDSIVGFTADPQKADVKFVKYYVDTIKLQMQNVSKGTTQDNLSLDKLLRFNFKVPSPTLQQKIASVIAVYDYLVENNNHRIKVLEEMAQAIYDEWFVKFRFPGHSKVKMVKSELGEMPESWAVKRLDDTINILSGFAFKSGTFIEDGKYGLVTIKNVQDGKFTTECDSRLQDIPEKMPRYCQLKDGDILLSLTGNVGRVCLCYGKNYLLNQRVAKLVPKEETDWAYVYFMYFQPQFRTKLEMISTGVAQQNLSPVEMGKIKMPYPPEALRKSYGDLCNPILKNILVLFQKNNILRQNRDILLPRLISGELDVEHLDIKVAN